MTKVYPNPFTTNPKNAEFVENNQIGLLLIDTENNITPITIETCDVDIIGIEYLSVVVSNETSLKYGITHPAWGFVIKAKDFPFFEDKFDGNKLDI